jgi:hypothetical protein
MSSVRAGLKGCLTGTTMLIGAGVVIVAVVLVGWNVGWWFTAQNVNRRAHITQNQYNTQEGYLSAISNDVANLDGIVAQEPGSPNQAALRAQAEAVAGQACLEANLLTGSVPVPASMATWIKTNCQAGALSPTSSVRTGGNGL